MRMLDQLGEQPRSAGTARIPSVESAPRQAPPSPPGGRSGQTGFEDVLRNILEQVQQGRQMPTPDARQAPPRPEPQPGAGREVSTELQDLLRQILEGRLGGQPQAQVSRAIGDGGAGEQNGAGRLAEALRQILGQAVAGAREGATRIDEATGISDRAREALGQATGQTPEELIAGLRKLIAENQLAAGAALGGLGALVLGNRTGRSLAGAAVKLGGLALIGGLAYKAYQNYQQGKPPLAAETETRAALQPMLPAPEGTGFEPGAVTHDAARRYIRAMIAAAAADGRIDQTEQDRILAGVKQAGLDEAAQHFLAAEITSPATVAELASGITSPEEALQVYTAARIAVDPDSAEEHTFLSALADALGIHHELARQVDAAARGTAGGLAKQAGNGRS